MLEPNHRRADSIVDRVEALFRDRGAEAYFGEPVTVADHMLQCATLAEAEGAPDEMVVAALLHDIGHLTGGSDYRPDDTVDHVHEEAGAAFLAEAFPPVIMEAVRLHVAAKRYLCAVDPAYRLRVSPASLHSLDLQGGPMTDAEIAQFESRPFHREAVRVRVWDDTAKDSDARGRPFDHFRAVCQKLGR